MIKIYLVHLLAVYDINLVMSASVPACFHVSAIPKIQLMMYHNIYKLIRLNFF